VVDIKTLLPELKKLVTELSEDLLARSAATEDIKTGLREAYTQIEKGGRTSDAFEVWLEDYLDQVAVAWVLGCVFVRFMEDNHLIDECWLAGEGDRRKQAEDSHELYFREHPLESDREYFEHVFREVGKIPACQDLFAEGKTPLWAVGPSGDAAMKLLAFWREIDTDSGHLKRTFDVEDSDTRFLGDLYQDLSERARKKYALLQTPVFVEEFILDRTLDPAIDEFGLDEVRMIDPTCGSGHFLLGGFARLFDLWIKREDNDIVAAQKALDGVWGVDINPFAVAIARFRLIVAALRTCDIKTLKKAPAWNIHLATGDSLLFGSRWDREGNKITNEQKFFSTDEENWAPDIYACEDKDAVLEVLGQQYHAVVGNPPYITVSDTQLNTAYRSRYTTCHRQYSLAAPFTERFFDLCIKPSLQTNNCAGYFGLILANSFMKREFGKKLIEAFLPSIDLTHIIDTSRAYIPGHGMPDGTPTAILFARARPPVSDKIRAVLGIKSEPCTPKDLEKGVVWTAICKHIDQADYSGEYISTADVQRQSLASHPWSLKGGGVSSLNDNITNSCNRRVKDFIADVGRSTHTGEDEAFYISANACKTRRMLPLTVPLVEGEGIRDYAVSCNLLSLFPYCKSSADPIEVSIGSVNNHFWTLRTTLKRRKDFGQYIEERGLRWIDHSMLFPNRFLSRHFIAYPEIATHNHFVIEQQGKLFKHSAGVIILAEDADEKDCVPLFGILSSSVVCFLLKQLCFEKGGKGEQWAWRYVYNATNIKKVPVPEQLTDKYVSRAAMELVEISKNIEFIRPVKVFGRCVPNQIELEGFKEQYSDALSRMRFWQEELDWEYYRLYGLIGDDLCYQWDEQPGIELGERAFEIVMARRMAKGELDTTWFEHHSSKPLSQIPDHWPESYKKLVERRIELIETSKNINLLEKPEYKRRWSTESWGDQQQNAIRNWLLGRLESQAHWPDSEHGESSLQSVANLADKASGDQELMQVASIYRGRDDFDLAALIADLVESESVPFLSVLRYKPAGLRKRKVWEKTWELQRKEDDGEDVGDIKVPPKYTSADFQKSDYWRLRGKLDVPKERWISFPHCETDGDPSLVVGWAGWNHLQQGTAIVSYYDARKKDGWSAERLTPLLAALDQLLPWIHQWHPEIDPEFNETAGNSFQTLLESEAQELGLTLKQIRSWKPPAKKKAAKKKAAKKPRKKAKSAEVMQGE
jgi:hypothetical protein